MMRGKGNDPPRLIMRFFRWFCHEELRSFVEGDLIELYQERLEASGRWRANWRLFIDVLLLLRPGIIGFSNSLITFFRYSMFKNHFKVGLRNLWKDRFYSAINLFGLSIGLSFSFLVLLLVKHEMSYEHFYDDQETIFRLGVDYNIGGQEDQYSNVPRPIGPTFKEEFPELVSYTRVGGVNGLTTHTAHLEFKERTFVSEKIFAVDSSFFDVFDTELLRGQPKTVLNRPNTVVLSSSMAATIFGNKDPIGKEIELLENGKLLEVTGIFEDIPANTHLPYDALVSWLGYTDESQNHFWFGRHVYTYIRLQDKNQVQSLLNKFPAFYDKHMSETFERLNGTADLIVQPISDIHLTSKLNWEPYKNGDLTSVYILLAIGIFLVVIAEVNYLNLSLARSSLRRKEISVRKVIGATKSNISGQFVVETMLFTCMAFGISLVILRLIESEFAALSGVNVMPFDTGHLITFLGITLMLGLIVSIYPSLILSGVRLVEGLKGRSKTSRKSGRLQRLLVIFQFAVSTMVILFTFVVKNQLDFVLNKDLGFQKENLAVFELQDSVQTNRIGLIKERIRGVGGVNAVSFSHNRPGVDLNHTVFNVESEGGYTNVGSQFMQIDEDFVNTVGLEILEGRSFIKGSEKDFNESVMINEAAIAKFGWGDRAIGRKLYLSQGGGNEPAILNVVGVFKDFNVGSLHTGIEPMIAFYDNNDGDQVLVRMSSNGQSATIAEIEQILNSYNPNIPAAYQFVEVELDQLYTDERRLSESMTYLSALTIIISVLGFIGLLSFSITQREKEIGVRKVLGANVAGVTMLFYKEILILIVIAQVMAVPVNYYLSSKWLNSFEYQVFPGILEFGLVLGAIILLSLGTMGFQIIRVAFMNPAKVIRDE